MERVFRDPVHDFIAVGDEVLLALIDTPEFQRLRRIRQLGAAYVTYHGAEHSRFTHSLGAMHIMRRILDRLAEQGWSLDLADRRAALSAALLHDVGHGPFSHLWEKAAGGPTHEEWTRAVISGDTAIHAVLEAADPGLPERVLAILDGRHPVPHLPALVSSQLDVDRMDYLLRDSLLTGASYGRFDLERLVYNVTVAGGRLAVAEKGLANVEEYLLARYFMYWRVYYHKTTRAQELGLAAVFARARELFASGRARGALWPRALVPFLEGRPGLRDHLAVDDYDVICACKAWSADPDPVLADLARRFLERRLLKPVFPEPREGEPPRDLEPLAALLARRGWDPRYYLAVDRAGEVPYYDYYTRRDGAADGGPPPILIVGKGGRVREVSEVSPLVRSIAAAPRGGFNVYVPAECREDAARVLAAAGHG